MGEHGVNEMLRSFVVHEQVRGCSPATIRRRAGTVRRLLEQAGCDPGEVTRDHVERFVAPHAPAETRRAYIGDVRRFYRWAILRELLEVDPTTTIEAPRPPRRVPTPLPAESVARVLEVIASDQDAAVIGLGLFAGLRCAEMCGLRVADIDMGAGRLVVRGGKGGHDRTLPVAARLRAMLEQVAPSDGHVIRARGTHAVASRVRRVYRRAGVVGHRPHDLRATFATELARMSGGNMQLVANLLGHASLETTMRYVRWQPSGAAEVELLHVA